MARYLVEARWEVAADSGTEARGRAEQHLKAVAGEITSLLSECEACGGSGVLDKNQTVPASKTFLGRQLPG